MAVPLDPGLSAGRTIGRLAADLPHASEAFRWVIDYYARLADSLSRLHRLGIASDRVRYVGHHEAHLASAFYTGPYREAALLSVDGSGDDNSAMWAHGTPDGIKVLDSVRMPASLGYFYGAITEYLGFIPNIDEGKVMGLAPYGQPSLIDEFVELLTPGPYGTFHLDLCYFSYHRRPQRMYSATLEDRFGPPRTPKSAILPRHQNIAHAAQASLEAVLLPMAKHLVTMTGSRYLCLAGGVALNSVANGRIAELPDIDGVHVAADPGDGGTALGAAFWLEHHLHPGRVSGNAATPYLGPEYDDAAVQQALHRHTVAAHRVADPAAEAAGLLAAGAIVGWFQGRAEVGPRALGNRSILAPPAEAGMKDKLNGKVKHREPFRPFAPAILQDRQGEYFLTDHPSYYMSHVHAFRPEVRDRVPAVVHVDGTGRLQTVSPDLNPLFGRLIAEFDRVSGVPVVLNTSFNVMGEPIVNTPDDAIRCYLGTGIDALVIGGWVAQKPRNGSDGGR